MIDTSLVAWAIAFVTVAAVATALALATIATVVLESRRPASPQPARRLRVAGPAAPSPAA